MATLGSAFPKAFRLRVAGTIAPGSVFYTLIHFEDGREREKFVVVGHVNEKYDVVYGLLINKNIHPLVANNQRAAACQVAIEPATDNFIKIASYVACHQMRAFKLSDILSGIEKEPGILRGTICADTKNKIIAAVSVAPAISVEHIQRICKSLKP